MAFLYLAAINFIYFSMASGKVLLGLFKTNTQKLQQGIWPWTQGLRSRLPEHFKKRYTEKFMKDPIPVHYRPDPQKYVVNTYGIVYVHNQSIKFKLQTFSNLQHWFN